MDSSITLSYGSRNTSTVVSNTFIDRYMTDARGSDVKVYIYLLRCLQDPSAPVSIESIASALDETEKEIRTALRYWAKQQVITVNCTRNGKIKKITLHDLDAYDYSEDEDDGDIDSFDTECNITILSDTAANENRKISKPVTVKDGKPYGRRSTDIAPVPETPAPVVSEPVVKPSYSSQMIESFKNEYPDFDELLDNIESILGRTLKHHDLQTPSFLFEGLGFPTDLICYLYDYCSKKGKCSNAFVEKIARDWHSKGIMTVSEAMMETDEFNNRYSAVKNAFGINRNFGEIELEYIRKWYHEFLFSDELIALACNKALLNTSQPAFQYADKILTSWHEQGVKTVEEAEKLSEDYKAANPVPASRRGTKNSALQYSQRTYTEAEISAIEKKKLGIL